MENNLVSITFLARWTGFSRPSQRCNRLVIQRTGDRYVAFDAMEQKTNSIESHSIQVLLDAIRLECSNIEPSLFGRSEDELDFHFGGCSTGDYPALKLRMEFEDGCFVEMRTNSQHAHLLPWKISDPDERNSFNPQISIRMAELMPDGFLFRDRLIDSVSLFDSERLFREEIAKMKRDQASKQSGENRESRTARVNEQLRRLADDAQDDECVGTAARSPQYTANQLRRLSEQQLSELVSNGFNLSTSDETGQTALMLAAFPPFNVDQFRKLVRVGADVNARRTDGLTGLMLACAGSEELSAKEWLLAGANVDIRGPKNSTALMLGAKNGVIVADLLAHGAKATDLDDDGDTALDYAMEDISIFWAGKRLNSVEMLSAALEEFGADSLIKSHKRALEVARRLRLEVEVEQEFGGRTMSASIREARTKQSQSTDQVQYLNDVLEFIDLEITEIEVADRIVEILAAAISRRS